MNNGKNTSNKNSETITAAISGAVVEEAVTKLLSNNNVRKYTKEEANFRNNNGVSESCATCTHSQLSKK